MSDTNTMATRIALGSGKIYLVEEPSNLDTSDEDAIISTYAVAANEFAAVKNGATLTYTPTTYTAKCDLGRFEKTVTQDESVTLGCGLITINGHVFNVLVDTGRVKTTASGNQVIKIGGTGNAKGKSYLIIFEHLDAKDGNIYVIIVGNNTAELQMAFQPGAETILNPTFTAQGMDEDGTKLIIVMQKPAAQGA